LDTCDTVLRRTMIAAWALAAAVNLSAGLWLATDPDRASDLENVERWGHQWLIDGKDVYARPGVTTSYPPHGIVALSPLGVIPPRMAQPAWLAVNVACAVLAPWLAALAVRPGAHWPDALLLILMFLCWGGVRSLLQFSLATLTFSLLAMRFADQRPRSSGLALAIGLIKPQIALPVFVWALLTRRLRVAGIALAFVMLGFAVFCIRARAAPLSVIAAYLGILQLLYLGAAIVVGLANVRELLALAISDTRIVDALAITIAAALLVVVWIVGTRERTRSGVVMYSAPPLVAVWSLLTFYHLTYGFVVLLPLAAVLRFSSEGRTATYRKRLFWGMQLALMIDVPGVWRRVEHLIEAPTILSTAAMQFDRALMLALFASVGVLAARAGRAAAVEQPPLARLLAAHARLRRRVVGAVGEKEDPGAS
jgi:hypothetical protein